MSGVYIGKVAPGLGVHTAAAIIPPDPSFGMAAGWHNLLPCRSFPMISFAMDFFCLKTSKFQMAANANVRFFRRPRAKSRKPANRKTSQQRARPPLLLLPLSLSSVIVRLKWCVARLPTPKEHRETQQWAWTFSAFSALRGSLH